MPQDGSICGLVDAVATHRNRPIDLVEAYLGSRATAGFWVIGQDRDYIVHPNGALALVRDLVICHELAHMLLGHGQHRTPGSPVPTPGGSTRLLTRHGFGSVAEGNAVRLAKHTAKLSLARRRARLRPAPSDRIELRVA
jgi:hypothetical protein